MQKITNQNAGRITEQGVSGIPATAQLGLINYVVMQQVAVWMNSMMAASLICWSP